MPDGPSFPNPFDWWVQALNLAPKNLNQSILPGWSFMTINENNSTWPETEQHILTRQSYGRQIGRMMDLVEEMVKAGPASVLSTGAYTKFEEVRADVETAKEEAADIRRRRLLEDLKSLKTQSPRDFDALIAEAHRD